MSSPRAKLVTRKTLSGQVYHYLKQAIILQEMPQFRMGEQINEVELAKMLGCSTTPIREAINMLRRDGLVVGSSFHASTIASYSFADIKNMLYVRKALEIAGLCQAFENIATADIARLRDNITLYSQAYAAFDFNRISDYNQEFHDYLMRRSGNKLLLSMLQSIAEQAAMIRAPLIRQQKRMPDLQKPCAVDEHNRILDALENQDLEGAKACLSRHIDRMQQDVCHFYETHPEQLGDDGIMPKDAPVSPKRFWPHTCVPYGPSKSDQEETPEHSHTPLAGKNGANRRNNGDH